MIIQIKKGTIVQGLSQGRQWNILKARVIEVLSVKNNKDFTIEVLETQIGNLEGNILDVYKEEIECIGGIINDNLIGTNENIGFLMGITSVKT